MTQADDIRNLLNASPTGQHLLLGEFVLPFAPGEDDPTGQTTNITDGRAQLWIDDDGAVQLSIYSRTNSGWTTVGESVLTTVNELVDSRFATQENSTDLKDVLVTAELVEDGAATPLDLDGGTATIGDLVHEGANLAFFSGAGTTKQTVTGSRGANAALATLLDALEAYGLITDSSTI